MMFWYVRLAFILLVTIVVSCKTSPPVLRENIPSPSAKPALSIEKLEKTIHALINKERAKKDLPSLSWNETLSRIARKHSSDMAAKKYFSHHSPEGRDFSYRYRKEGYACAVSVKEWVYTGGENIFQNNLYNRVVFTNGAARYDWNTPGMIAETTVQGWMNSAGHKKNILTPHWRSEGIGIAVSPDDKVYITQNFC